MVTFNRDAEHTNQYPELWNENFIIKMETCHLLIALIQTFVFKKKNKKQSISWKYISHSKFGVRLL